MFVRLFLFQNNQWIKSQQSVYNLVIRKENICYNNKGDTMGIFDLFTTPQEKKTKEILANKPKILMHTSTVFPDKVYSIKPTFSKEKNISMVFATDDEKIAALYTLQPFYAFSFGNNERAVIILGTHHSLLQIDSKIAYTYFLNSELFQPVISEQGEYDHEWIANVEISIRKDIPPKKIHFNDVLRSGIQVFWINNIGTLLEIDKQIATENIVTGDQKLEYLMNQTNWKPDKVMYLNAYRNICPAVRTEKGWGVNYNMQVGHK